MADGNGVPLLQLDRLTMRFGGVTALSEVDLEVTEGEIFALIGPYGAGKTTVFNVVTGVFKPSSGSVRFGGRSILNRKQHQITQAGIARTFQNIRLFADMTALENVLVGADAHHRTSVPGAVLGLLRHRREEQEGRELALRLLGMMGLERRSEEMAKNLSYGDQRRLEIARALATRPRLLLLDEPSMGLAPKLVAQIFSIISEINQLGTTILLVEQNAAMALQRAHRAYVLETGSIVRSDEAGRLLDDDSVRAAYLGGAVSG